MLDFILTGNSEGRTLTVAFPDFSTRVFTEETPGFENIIDVILDQTGDDFETADLIISIIADDNTDDPDSVCPDDCTCEDNVDLVDNDVPSLKSIICDLARMFESENSEEVNSSSHTENPRAGSPNITPAATRTTASRPATTEPAIRARTPREARSRTLTTTPHNRTEQTQKDNQPSVNNIVHRIFIC